MGSPTPQNSTGTDHVITSNKLSNTGGRAKEPASGSFCSDRKIIFCIPLSFGLCKQFETVYIQLVLSSWIHLGYLFCLFSSVLGTSSLTAVSLTKLYFCPLNSIMHQQHTHTQPQYHPQCLPGLWDALKARFKPQSEDMAQKCCLRASTTSVPAAECLCSPFHPKLHSAHDDLLPAALLALLTWQTAALQPLLSVSGSDILGSSAAAVLWWLWWT